MKKETSRELTRQQKAELEDLAALPDERIDTSDIPEIGPAPVRGPVGGNFHAPE